MGARIYLLDGDSALVPMEEAPYDSERLLQVLLAKHQDLLVGESRQWVLFSECEKRFDLMTQPSGQMRLQKGIAPPDQLGRAGLVGLRMTGPQRVRPGEASFARRQTSRSHLARPVPACSAQA